MFSLGTDCDLALAIASARVGLPVGSPPPVLAATSIDLISLANSLPRRASMTAFLCFVVAHLLWPLIDCPSSTQALHHRNEQIVHPPVGGQLRMDRRREHGPAPHGHRPLLPRMLHAGEDLDRRSCLLDCRRA